MGAARFLPDLRDRVRARPGKSTGEASTLTIQILALIVAALYARAGAVALRRPISDFYVAGRLVPAIFNGAAIAIGLVPVLAFAGLAGGLGQDWNGALVLALGGAVSLVAIAVLLAPYLRKFGGYTVPDFLAERFGLPGIRLLAVLGVILCAFPALALTVLGLGALATRIFAIGLGTGVALGVAMLLSCSFAAGMRSASLTQLVQYAVLLAASFVAFALLLLQQGAPVSTHGFAGVSGTLASIKLEAFTAADQLNRLAALFCLAAGIVSLPHLLLRASVTPIIAEARTSFLWALPFTAALCFVAVFPLGLLDEAPGPAANTASILAFGFTAIGAIAALLALGSGLALAIANALSYDLYYKAVHPTASTERRILVARVAVVVVTVLAAWAALAAQETVLAMTGACLSLAASTFLPALLLGTWWKRASGEGALAGMLAGLAVCLYYMLAPRYIPFAFYETSSFLSNATPDEAARYDALRQSYYLADETTRNASLAVWAETARAVANWGGVKRDFAAVFALPIGIAVMIGVSLFTRAPDREIQSFVEELRKSPAA